ncbi:MAG: hypothetical protein R3C42_04795 [Parvularculaceae bacterium]
MIEMSSARSIRPSNAPIDAARRGETQGTLLATSPGIQVISHAMRILFRWFRCVIALAFSVLDTGVNVRAEPSSRQDRAPRLHFDERTPAFSAHHLEDIARPVIACRGEIEIAFA